MRDKLAAAATLSDHYSEHELKADNQDKPSTNPGGGLPGEFREISMALAQTWEILSTWSVFSRNF